MSFNTNNMKSMNDMEQRLFKKKRDEAYNNAREELLRKLLREIADEYDSASYVGLFELFSDISKIEERTIEQTKIVSLNNAVRLDITKNTPLSDQIEPLNELNTEKALEKEITDGK